MTDTILYDSAMRLFGDHVTPQVLAAAERRVWPAALWDAVVEAGFPDALADGPDGMVEAVAILRAAGHHAVPLPLVEAMLARWLCSLVGYEPPTGTMSVAIDDGDPLTLPWGGTVSAVAIIDSGLVRLVLASFARFEPGASLAGEPRDRLVAVEQAETADLPNCVSADLLRGLGAVMRAAQMAGAMEAALDLSVRCANDRVQFGRPIGKFQAIQQQLALLAEEAAASLVAAESAARAIAASHPSAALAIAAAKIRAGEAAAKVTDIAHQVHGAIGFTWEHSLHFLTRRLWSWRDDFGDETYWATALGRRIAAAGGAGLWPLITQS